MPKPPITNETTTTAPRTVSLGELLKLRPNQAPLVDATRLQFIDHLTNFQSTVRSNEPQAKLPSRLCTARSNWTSARSKLYLAVLPVPDGDAVVGVGGDEPGVGGVELDLHDLVARRPERPEAEHLAAAAA